MKGVHHPRVEHRFCLLAYDDVRAASTVLGRPPQVELERDVLWIFDTEREPRSPRVCRFREDDRTRWYCDHQYRVQSRYGSRYRHQGTPNAHHTQRWWEVETIDSSQAGLAGPVL